MDPKVEVKIVTLTLGDSKQATRAQEAERLLAQLRNEGWELAACGGGTGKAVGEVAGFVILERDLPPGTSW